MSVPGRTRSHDHRFTFPALSAEWALCITLLKGWRGSIYHTAAREQHQVSTGILCPCLEKIRTVSRTYETLVLPITIVTPNSTKRCTTWRYLVSYVQLHYCRPAQKRHKPNAKTRSRSVPSLLGIIQPSIHLSLGPNVPLGSCSERCWCIRLLASRTKSMVL